MSANRGLAACLGVAVISAALGFAGDIARRPKELEPRPCTFSRPNLPLKDALAELAQQTGNLIADQRMTKSNPVLMMPLGPLTFWAALDRVGKEAGIGFNAYRDEGEVALVDARYRSLPTAYAGLFRIAVRRKSVMGDLDAQTHLCILALDVAWEPRFQPLLFDLKQASLTFAPDAAKKTRKETSAGYGVFPVAGRSAVEIEVRVTAADRSCPSIDVLEGTLSALGPVKMLDFTFKDLQALVAKPVRPIQGEQDGVTVRIVSAKFNRDVVSIALTIENPRGGPVFESFQNWLDNNKIKLTDGDKRVLLPESSEASAGSANPAQVTYHFRAGKNETPPRSLEGWALHYRTPGRIVEVREAFRIENIPLP